MFTSREALAGCLVAVLALAGTAGAQTLAGLVLDPQERRIAGAEVRLACAGEVRRAATDREGQFRFDRQAPFDSCVLHVTARGFAPSTEPVGPRRRVPWVVRLALEPVTETIEVRGEAGVQGGAIGGRVLRGSDVSTISNDPRDIVRYARARAGSAGDAATYVDGLPSQHLPPVSRIAAVSVNADPFSVEFSDAGARRIEIVTRAPDRRWRANVGGAPPTAGGRNPLSPGSRSRTRSLTGTVSGPLPWHAASFGVTAGLDDVDSQPPIVAVVPGEEGSGRSTRSTTARRVASVQFHQQLAAATSVRIEAQRAADRNTNAGVGAEVLEEAGSARSGNATGLRMAVTHHWGRASWRTQLSGDWRSQETAATSSGLGVWIPGAFIRGGAPTVAAASGQRQLAWKSVVVSAASDRPWLAGFTAQRASGRSAQVPNPAGYAQFASPDEWLSALDGSSVGNHYVLPAPASQDMVLSDAAAFAETTLASRSSASLKGGVRVDWQSGDRVRLSPRVSAMARTRAWTLNGGFGAFTRDWRPELFLGTARAAGQLPVQLLARQVSFAEIDAARLAGDPIETRVAPGFTRARYLMATEAAERPLGPVMTRVEHVWWRGRHLAGARRLPAAQLSPHILDPASAGLNANAGWIDWLESNRQIDSHELRAQVEAGGPRSTITFTYGWIHSVDEGDGAFFYPARQNDLAGERARSARTPVHSLDIVGSTTMPGHLRTTVIATLRSSSPYNVVTGLDAEGNGLQTDRGGRPRNSGDGPPFRTVSIYLHRRFNLAAIFGSHLNAPIDAGAHLDNLLGTRNWTSLGGVIGSPLFGRPEGALPGRTLRVWFAIAR